MVGTKEAAAAAKGGVIALKKTAAIIKPIVVGNGSHNGHGKTGPNRNNGKKKGKNKKTSKKTATWSYGAPKNVVLQNSLYTSGYGSLTWQNLHEATCLASLPEPLRSLVHFKQLSREMLARTLTTTGSSYGYGSSTNPSMEGHRQTVDMAYLTALQQYIATLEEDNTDDPETDNEVAKQTHHEQYATKTEQLFQRAETMAFLYRYASSLEEQQVLHEEYRKQTAKYIVHMMAGKTSTTTNTTAVATAVAEEPDAEEDGEAVEAAEESEAPGMTGEGEEEEDEEDEHHHHADAAVAADTSGTTEEADIKDSAAMEGVEE